MLSYRQTGFLIVFKIFIILPMLGPVAENMGIDLIWFGVLICANMQKSFSTHPSASRCFTCAASPTRCSRMGPCRPR